MRITLRWHLAVYFKPLTVSMFFITVVCKYVAFGCSE